ncbi:hypothetical protein PX52LOC_06359 [Limnoglobus roseus]|uniref:Uncharacterized protein n=1 Tax=Limnoglobus roseus TaxID=2598579 RepID=A0A5C1AKZ8_9BACT|nr:hypothetical protein PX52LOC_06359 [Limnoglobus roseus]
MWSASLPDKTDRKAFMCDNQTLFKVAEPKPRHCCIYAAAHIANTVVLMFVPLSLNDPTGRSDHRPSSNP